MSIASCRQSLIACLVQRMIRDLTLADQILGAGDLIGENRRDQVLGLHPQELRRHFPAAAKSRQGERTPATQRHRVVNIGASSMAWTSTARTLLELR